MKSGAGISFEALTLKGGNWWLCLGRLVVKTIKVEIWAWYLWGILMRLPILCSVGTFSMILTLRVRFWKPEFSNMVDRFVIIFFLPFGLVSKTCLSKILDNSVWNVGNWENIRFWMNNWCDKSLLQIYEDSLQDLNTKSSDYIVGSNIVLPNDIALKYPMLLRITEGVYPNVFHKDKLMWNRTNNGQLNME